MSLVAALKSFISPSPAAAKAAKGFGLELSIAGLKAEGLAGALVKLSKLKTQQLGEIFGNVRAFRGLATQLQNITIFQKNLAFISEKSAGQTQVAYEKMAATVGFKFARLKQGVISVFRAIGKPLLGVIARLLDKMLSKFDGIEIWIVRNQKTIESWANTFESKLGSMITTAGDLIDFFKVDFPKALKFSFDTMVKLFKVAINAMIRLGILVGRGVVIGLQQTTIGLNLTGKSAKAREELKREINIKRLAGGKKPIVGGERLEDVLGISKEEAQNIIFERARLISTRDFIKSLGSDFEKIQEIMKEGFAEIGQDFNRARAESANEKLDMMTKELRRLANTIVNLFQADIRAYE